LEDVTMKKITLLIVVIATLLLSTAVFAEEKPATEQVQSSTGQAERPRERLQNLTPEERAKLREKWQTMSEEERAQLKAKLRERAGAERPGPGAAQKVFADELVAFKRQHERTRGELQSIKQLAVKEKATETAKALEKLMARNEADYQKRLKQLEQRQQRLQAAQKSREQQVQKPDSTEQSQPGDTGASQSGRQRQRSNTPRSRQ
jgi:hypothetical protein